MSVLFIRCDEEKIIPLSLEAFTFKKDNNHNLERDYKGEISANGDTVHFLIPHFTAITSLIASYEIPSGATAFIDGTAQTSGNTANDFTNAVTYKISAGQDEAYFFVVQCTNKLILSTVGYSQDSTRIGAGDFTKETLFKVSNINRGTWSYTISIGELHHSDKAETKGNAFEIPNFLSLDEWLALNGGEDGVLDIKLALSSETLGVQNQEFTFSLNKEQYNIRSWQDLQAMRYDLHGAYRIYNNIEFPYYGLEQFPREGFTPIGDSLENSFKGSLDGQNHVISNFYINQAYSNLRYVGLFGVIERRADILPVIKNLGLHISEREESGGITGGLFAGGIAGWSEGKIINCYVIGDVTTTGDNTQPSAAGGLVGCNFGGEIERCYTSGGKTEGVVRAGGLVGENTQDGKISRSYSNQYVVITGVSGYGKQPIAAGGLVGNNSMTATIFNSYSTGDIVGNENIGGFVGRHSLDATIRTSYSMGNVIEADADGSSEVGGFIGKMEGKTERRSITDSYWNVAANPALDGVGDGEDYGTDGRSVREFKNEVMYVGWDFTNTWSIDGIHNDGYAHLKDVKGQ